MAHFSNAELAQKLSDLVAFWSTFNTQYKNWLGGSAGGGPGADGKYPLTDFTGTESLVDCPAELADGVGSSATAAAASATAAAASATAAASSDTDATAEAVTATAQAVIADAQRVLAETAETGAVDAKATAIAQQIIATAKAVLTAADLVSTNADVVLTNADVVLSGLDVGYASEWAITIEDTLISAAAGGNQSSDYSALHWAAKAATFDPLNFYLRTALDTGQLDNRYYTETEIDSTLANLANWDTAYGWGDHASGGYMDGSMGTSLVADSVASVDINAMQAGSDTGYYKWGSSQPSTGSPGFNYGIMFAIRDTNQQIQIAWGGSTSAKLKVRRADSGTFYGWTTFWNDADFSQSDLDDAATAYGWGDHASGGYMSATGTQTFGKLVSASNLVTVDTDILITDNGNIGATQSLNFLIDTDNNNTGKKFQWGHNAPGTDNMDLLMTLEEDGDLIGTGQLSGFTSHYYPTSTGDKISLYDDRLGLDTMYGIGMESSYTYYKGHGGGGHRWYVGVNADGGTSDTMQLTSSLLTVNVAMVATSYDGVAAANLLDKTASENITASWIFDGASGGTGLYLDSTASWTSGTLYAPALRWREDDGTSIAGMRGYVNSGDVKVLQVGTGWLSEKFRIQSDGFHAVTGNWAVSGNVTGSNLNVTQWNKGFGSYQWDGSGGAINGVVAGLFTGSSTRTGALKIAFPVDVYAASDMLSFEVTIFDYSTSESVKLFIAGYIYQVEGQNEWVNETAIILSNQAGKEYTVRFGAEGGRHCVWIGETDDVWQYPQVTVYNLMSGYTTADISKYEDDWVLSWATTLGTIDDTITATYPYAHSNPSLSPLLAPLASPSFTGDVYMSGDSIGHFQTVTGSYGSVQVAGAEGSSGVYSGYSIDGKWVFMGTTTKCGIYNDINNEWFIECLQNAGVKLRYNNSVVFETVSGGASVTGTLVATSFGGITSANLLDKAATEAITGAYSFTNAARLQSTGRSASWGSTSGAATGAFNAVMGTSSSATWMVSASSGGTFRGGIQVLDSSGSSRWYAGATKYIDLSSSGITLLPGDVKANGFGVLRHVTTGYTNAEVTVASSAPGSPAKGDIWFDTT